jgi:ribosomal-protein-alanine acetyltransferase
LRTRSSLPRVEIEIRQARFADLKRMLEIENASFPIHPWDREIFLNYMRDCGDMFFVAKLGRRVCGYVIIAKEATRAELASIAVDPAYRGRGIAHKMMEHTLSLLRHAKIETWWLTARVNNVTAINFYISLGFRRTRTVKSYYENGEDGLRMQLKL